MDYMQNNFIEIAKAGNLKFIEKIPTGELTAQNIFNLIKFAKDKNQKSISKIILNKSENHDNEVKALKLAFIQANIPVAWLILNTWPQPLEKIDVSNCHLEQFPSIPSNVSANLKEIDISGNHIDILNISLIKFPNLKQVILEGNPLSIYPERCRTSWAKMKEYLQSIETRAECRNIKKVLIVGEEGVGKSTLLKCLRKKTHKTNVTENISTDGIDISDVTLTPSDENSAKPMVLKTWDFGGQEVYYPSHQFFLTSKSIYILCFNLVSLNITRISYWIQQIQSMCKISDDKHTIDNNTISSSSSSPPIFLVGTHLDDKLVANNSIEALMEELQLLFLKFRYQGFFRIFCVSCKSGRGIPELKDSLYQICHESVKGRGNISPSWILFMDYLQRTKESGISYLEWPKYEQIALKFKLQGSVLLTCTNYLSDVGAILYYHLSSKIVDSELIILDPQWLSDLMMCIFTTKSTFIKNGILSPSDLPYTFRNYRPYLHQSILALLSKFEVIYQMNSGEFLIPNLLPNSYPTDQYQKYWKTSPNSLSENEKKEINYLPFNFNIHQLEILEQGRIYEFSFLPLGFFSRVIVRLLNIKFISGLVYWKNGAILAIPSTNQYAKIVYDEVKLTLNITVRVPHYANTQSNNNIIDKNIIDKNNNNNDNNNDNNKNNNNESGYKSAENCVTFMLLRVIIDEIEMLLECFYPRLMEITKRLIPCTHCTSLRFLNSHLEVDSSPYLFTLEEIMEAVTKGDYYVFCNSIISPSRLVKIEELAPDISFADLPKINDAELQITEEIGEGSFGQIYKGVWNGVHVAIKTMKPSLMGIDRSKFWEFQQECFLMSNLEHANIVNLYGVTLSPMRMIMELVIHGDLYDLMHPPDPSDRTKRTRSQADISNYSLKYRMKIALDIAKAMQYLQNIIPPIIHRDLRSPNIFIMSREEEEEVVAKVADFGLSRTISSNVAGTLNSWQWLAPEVINNSDDQSSEYGLKSDVYSFGIILWELITFQHPFDEFIGHPKYTRTLKDGTGNEFKMLNPNEVKHSIIFDHLRPTIPLIGCSNDVMTIIDRCWSFDPDKRPSFDEIMQKEEIVISAQKSSSARISAMLVMGKQLWVNHFDGVIQIISTDTKSIKFSSLSSPTLLKTDGKPMKSICKVFRKIDEITPQINVWATARFEKLIYVWDALNLELVKVINLPALGNCISKCGETAVWVGMENGEIISFDIQSFDVIGSWTAHAHPITSLFYHRNFIWTGSHFGALSVWSLLDENQVSLVAEMKAQLGEITAITVIGDYICTLSSDQSIVVWHFPTQQAKQEITEISMMNGEVTSMISMGQFVYCSTTDQSIQLLSYNLPLRIGFSIKKDDQFDYLLDENDNMSKGIKGKKSLFKNVSIGLIRKRSPSTPNTNAILNLNNNNNNNNNNSPSTPPLSRHSIDHQTSFSIKQSEQPDKNNNNNVKDGRLTQSDAFSPKHKRKFRLFGSKSKN